MAFAAPSHRRAHRTLLHRCVRFRQSFEQKGHTIKTRTTESKLVVNQTAQPDPAFMQKYSHEVRERIAKKAYELYRATGRRCWA